MPSPPDSRRHCQRSRCRRHGSRLLPGYWQIRGGLYAKFWSRQFGKSTNVPGRCRSLSPTAAITDWLAVVNPAAVTNPSHRKMGRITLPLLELLQIPYCQLPDNSAALPAVWAQAIAHLQQQRSPFAIVVRKGTFAAATAVPHQNEWNLPRETAIIQLAQLLPPAAVIVATNR